MPLYFFDIDDGGHQRDDEGVECDDLQAIAKYVKRVLPEIAAHEVPTDGDHQTITVLVSDEEGRSVYLAALTYTSVWLIR